MAHRPANAPTIQLQLKNPEYILTSPANQADRLPHSERRAPMPSRSPIVNPASHLPQPSNPTLRYLLLAMFTSCAIASIALPAPAAQPTTSDRLQALARKITYDWAKDHPLTATYLGLSD